MAHSFNNLAGDMITINLDALSFEKAEQELGIDLFSLDSISEACSNVGSMTRLLHVLSDSEETVEEFAAQLKGNQLLEAQEALQAELIEFLPSTQAEFMQNAIKQIEASSAGVLQVLREKFIHLQTA